MSELRADQAVSMKGTRRIACLRVGFHYNIFGDLRLRLQLPEQIDVDW